MTNCILTTTFLLPRFSLILLSPPHSHQPYFHNVILTTFVLTNPILTNLVLTNHILIIVALTNPILTTSLSISLFSLAFISPLHYHYPFAGYVFWCLVGMKKHMAVITHVVSRQLLGSSVLLSSSTSQPGPDARIDVNNDPPARVIETKEL